MNDHEVLKDWHRRHLNETLDEHDMQMDRNPPQNVLAALHWKNEQEDESAMLRTSNGRHENVVGTVRITQLRVVKKHRTYLIEGSVASASNVAAGSGG